MIEIKSKLLVITVALAIVLLATPLVGVVQAGKGQTRQSFELIWQEHPLSTDGPAAHGSFAQGILRTFHGRDSTHDSPILGYTITIGGTPASFTLTDRDGGCDYEFNSNTMIVIHRATEKLALSDGVEQGTIVFSIIEKIDWSTMISEGTFVGLGTGLFEDVKIVGTISSEIIDWGQYTLSAMILEVTFAGTVMGWPL